MVVNNFLKLPMKLEQYEQLFEEIELLFSTSTTESECLDSIYRKITKFKQDSKNNVNFDYIERRVCVFNGISVKTLQSKTRERTVVEARQLCQFISKVKMLGTYKTIGDRFGGVNHSSVYYSLNVVSNLFDTDSEFKRKYLPLLTHFQITL